MYHVIINGINMNSRPRALEEVESVFRRAGKAYTLHFTQYAGHAADIAYSLTKGGRFACLIAMGGDGTLHEVLNGAESVENCTLGVIPIGTGNDFASAAGIPKEAKTAAEVIAFRAPTYIDYIELDNGLRSINAVGTGIDVDVLTRVYSGRKKGKGKYFSAFVKSLISYKCTTFKLICDGKESTHTGLIAALGNGRYIGGGIKLFPEARLDDGYMDLLVVDYLSRFRSAVAFSKLVVGRVNKVKEATYIRCRSAEIVPEVGESTIQAEGEIYENIRFSARVVANKLKFYLPEND